MQIWKKALVVLVLASTVMGLVATQYAKLGVNVSAGVSTRYSFIQLMAGDSAVVGSGYILTNSSGNYTVQLGTFAKGFNKTYTAAFAIVNSESNVRLQITSIDFGAADSIRSYAIVALHENMSINAFNEAAGRFIVYFDKGTAYNVGSNGFVLRNGQGDYSGSNLQYTADNGGSWTSASWDATNVWKYNAALVNSDVDTTTSSRSNFVWVQITLDLATASDGTSLTGTLYINVQSV
ncbi:MAG: hypothetical protein N3F63_04755 [Thermoplasmata archaeon]|nr:hypothetical protein [Thermoplasmata archaeon]